MFEKFPTIISTPQRSALQMQPDMLICQSDYPLDWYQEEFKPYAEEFLALPDRRYDTVINWMEPYIRAAQDHFGDQLLLLAHYYMGGEIVKLVEHFGGTLGDSYQLALMAVAKPEKKVIVESAVHFMAESISILAAPDQTVYITNPKAGCTMEMFAKDYMVEPALLDLNARYGENNILPICYMNTSGRIKALVGAQGGAVNTSSNMNKIFQWAMSKNKKILFIPDRNMGQNAAHDLGIAPDDIAYWPAGQAAINYRLDAQDEATLKRFNRSRLILFSSLCGVHDYYRGEMVDYWKNEGFYTIAHPECRPEVIQAAHAHGSTAFIMDCVLKDRAKTKHYAVATENHMVKNLKEIGERMGITVVNISDSRIPGQPNLGCGCATMARNDPPHLVAVLDLLRQGKSVEANRVLPGDVVNEGSGVRQRLSPEGQAWLVKNARAALERMIEITEKH